MMQTLDVTRLPPAIRHGRIFEMFDALAVGDALELCNDHYPLPLLYQFQAERERQFDWSVLESGEVFRVAITKRDDAKPRGVDECLAWDHDRLDAILDATFELFEARSVEAARKRFAEFVCGLERHIAAEEKIVFPAFEAGSGHEGPTRVMRIEHEQIHRTLRDIESALAQGDAAAFARSIESLVSILGEHNAKEEHVLYPAIDRALEQPVREELVRRIQTLRV